MNELYSVYIERNEKDLPDPAAAFIVMMHNFLNYLVYFVLHNFGRRFDLINTEQEHLYLL
jgi:hypothetical protein